jgi:hypothetical protein
MRAVTVYVGDVENRPQMGERRRRRKRSDIVILINICVCIMVRK